MDKAVRRFARVVWQRRHPGHVCRHGRSHMHKVPRQQSVHHTVQPVKHDTRTGFSVVELLHGVTLGPCGWQYRIGATTMLGDGPSLLLPLPWFGSDSIFANCLTFNITRKYRCFPTKTVRVEKNNRNAGVDGFFRTDNVPGRAACREIVM